MFDILLVPQNYKIKCFDNRRLSMPLVEAFQRISNFKWVCLIRSYDRLYSVLQA